MLNIIFLINSKQKGLIMIRIKEKCVDHAWMEAWSLADKILLEALHFLETRDEKEQNISN